jgi:hypothetical protein
MKEAHRFHTATLLGNGEVLVTGVQGKGAVFLASAELYDPATNAWSLPGAMSQVRDSHTATRRGNGSVLVAGDRAA